VSSTGNQSVLRDLYDAIPEIDRAEIGGSVSIVIRENGEETREQRSFDLVLRDRMGNPLFVADLNDSRDPRPPGHWSRLSRTVATSPSRTSRSPRRSRYNGELLRAGRVRDRERRGRWRTVQPVEARELREALTQAGYHLCLVEARDGGFHMTVPDL